MRKITTLIVIGLYLAGVLIISFFGAALSGLEAIVAATDVRFLNEEIERDRNGDKYLELRVKEAEFPFSLQLEFMVFPDDTTDPSVYFVYDVDSAQRNGITVEESGLVAFTTWSIITIRVFTQSNKSDKVTIIISYSE